MPLREELTVVLANPRGFCGGGQGHRDRRAGARPARRPVYVRHEIVHNRHVVARLRRQGAIFVESLEEVPAGAVTVFSAHGVSQAVEEEARDRGLAVIDATCPLVTKVHRQGRRYAEKGFSVVLIGHEGHAEVEGTRGQVPGGVTVVGSAEEVAHLAVADPSRVAYVTQTTLSVDDTREVVDAVKARFPAAVGPELDDICYATQNRQTAVTMMVEDVELDRARLGQQLQFQPAARDRHQGGHPRPSRRRCLRGRSALARRCDRVGITAGASAPEDLVRGLIDRLSAFRTVTVESVGDVHETVEFRLLPRSHPPARA